MAGLFSANADTERATTDSTYTTADIQNLQNFLLERETPDLSKKDYDLNGDGVWNVLDLSLMKQQYQPQTSGKTLVAYYSASGTTERIAEYLAEEMNADVFVITPVNEYTSTDLNWTDSNSRIVQSMNIQIPDMWNWYKQHRSTLLTMIMFSLGTRFGGRRLLGW